MKRLLLLATWAFLLALGQAHADDGLNRIFPAGTKEPQVAVSPSGTVFVVAARDDVIEVVSSSSGKEFGAPIRVAQAPGLMLGMRRGPRVAATGASVVVTAIAKMAATDRVVELLSWRSVDGGATWLGPKRVNGATGAASEGLQGLAAGRDERLACAWLDSRAGGSELYVATSADGGDTWAEALAYRSSDGHICECCHPSVAWSANGDLAIMWRNWLGGSRDLWFARSKDDGKTFPKPEKIGEGTWPLNACPMDGGGMAVRPDGRCGTIWRRKNEMFFGEPGTKEQCVGSGLQGAIANGPSGYQLVWLDKKGGDVLTVGSDARKPERIGTKAGNPSVAGSLSGRGPVVAAWATDAGVFARVLCARK